MGGPERILEFRLPAKGIAPLLPVPQQKRVLQSGRGQGYEGECVRQVSHDDNLRPFVELA